MLRNYNIIINNIIRNIIVLFKKYKYTNIFILTNHEQFKCDIRLIISAMNIIVQLQLFIYFRVVYIYMHNFIIRRLLN